MHVIALVGRCEKGVIYNWSKYLCNEFLENVHEAQEEGKKFHYAWILLLISLIGWNTPKGTQFLEIEPQICEATNYATLWNSSDPVHIKENKIFWVLYDATLYQAVQSKPQLSPTLYDQYKMVAKFKATFHNTHIYTKGVVEGVWNELLYLVIEDYFLRMMT